MKGPKLQKGIYLEFATILHSGQPNRLVLKRVGTNTSQGSPQEIIKAISAV